MAPADDVERVVVGDLRPHVPLALGHLGERGEHIELRDHGGRALQPRDRLAHAIAQRLEQLAFAGLDALGGTQHARLVLLELRRDVALFSGERLPPLVLGRNEMLVGVGDRDVVAEHLVVADLERLDAGARALGGLDLGNGVLAAVAKAAELVELRIRAGADARLVADGGGRPLDERGSHLLGEVDAAIPTREQRREHAGLAEAAGCVFHLGQPA